MTTVYDHRDATRAHRDATRAHRDATRAQCLVSQTLGDIFAPQVPITPTEWARQHLVVPDGPRKLEIWDPTLTPYIAEPLDATSTESVENHLCIMKSAQTGFTTMLLAAIAYTIAKDRADMMVVQPTDGALTDFNSKKLGITLEETRPVAKLVARQTARSGTASTTYEKRFGRYSLTLALASSSADLRSKTVRKVFLDETDEYPDDLNGQGSPFAMIEARQESFLKTGDWKRVEISTPTIKGASHIEGVFEASDKRRWHVTCPHCTHEFVFTFGPHFIFNKEHPFDTYYACEDCGSIITESHRIGMIKSGRWIATDPSPGATRGYHFDALSSPFVPWSKIAERFVKAGDDSAKLMTFYNLTLGLAYEMRGDAPDHVKLMERREEFRRGHVPARGLILTAAADVQMRGIWLEILAIAPNRETWVVDALYLDGDTSSPDSEVFDKLRRETLDRAFPDAFGRTRQIDALAIDSGYRSHVVYAFARAHQRQHADTGRDKVLAVKGLEGWGKPAIGQPSLVDINLDGARTKHGARVWGIGTWSLKGAFYADLRKQGLKAGAEIDPDGYCHFGTWMDEVYFRQITSEYLADIRYQGRLRRQWRIRGGEKDNHFLDCRVYNLALAEYLGLSTTTPLEWAALARARGLPEAMTAIDLFTPHPASLAPPLSSATAHPSPLAKSMPSAPAEPSPSSRSGFLTRQPRRWIN